MKSGTTALYGRGPATNHGLPVTRTLFGALALPLALALAACSPAATGGGGMMMHAALTTALDRPGASFDRAQGLSLVNAYRSTVGAVLVADDAALTATAQQLANAYAASGNPPPAPAGSAGMRLSAGYVTFADAFSGWRNSPPDAAVLATRTATRAGLAFAYNPASSYGVYWVLLLGN